jgi:FixJ family two-component response regulator
MNRANRHAPLDQGRRLSEKIMSFDALSVCCFEQYIHGAAGSMTRPTVDASVSHASCENSASGSFQPIRPQTPDAQGGAVNEARVFLVDDDPSALRAMTRFLRETGFEVSPFQSARDFLSHHDMQVPGCAVLDVALGDRNGLELHREMSSKGGMRPTIFITGRGDVPTSVSAMKSGAVDFLMKPVLETDLVAAVRSAIERDLRNRAEDAKLRNLRWRIAHLTRKERDVLVRVLDGQYNKEIAAAMDIAEKTVKVHRGHVMTKMGVRSLVDLVRLVEPHRAAVLNGESGEIRKRAQRQPNRDVTDMPPASDDDLSEWTDCST